MRPRTVADRCAITARPKGDASFAWAEHGARVQGRGEWGGDGKPEQCAIDAPRRCAAPDRLWPPPATPLAMPATIALRARLRPARLKSQNGHVIHNLHRTPKLRGHRSVRMIFFYACDTTRAKLYRTACPSCPKYLPCKQGPRDQSVADSRSIKAATRSDAASHLVMRNPLARSTRCARLSTHMFAGVRSTPRPMQARSPPHRLRAGGGSAHAYAWPDTGRGPLAAV